MNRKPLWTLTDTCTTSPRRQAAHVFTCAAVMLLPCADGRHASRQSRDKCSSAPAGSLQGRHDEAAGWRVKSPLKPTCTNGRHLCHLASHPATARIHSVFACRDSRIQNHIVMRQPAFRCAGPSRDAVQFLAPSGLPVRASAGDWRRGEKWEGKQFQLHRNCFPEYFSPSRALPESSRDSLDGDAVLHTSAPGRDPANAQRIAPVGDRRLHTGVTAPRPPHAA